MGIAGAAVARRNRRRALVSFAIQPRRQAFWPDRDLGSRNCRGAMGIAGGVWGAKPEPFCLFLGAAEVF